MFRNARSQELLSFAQACDAQWTPTQLSDSARRDADAAHKLLSSHLTRNFTQRAVALVGRALSAEPALERELAVLYQSTLPPPATVASKAAAEGFADGAVTVLERDFVQLLNGPHAVLLEDAGSVEFLLGKSVWGSGTT